MPVSFRDRGMLIEEYLWHEKERAKKLVSGHVKPEDAYSLQGEPISSLFATEVTTRAIGIKDAEDPFKAAVISESTVKWNAQTLKMLKALETANVPYQQYGRGGCLHQVSFAAKRIAKWRDQTRFLINDAVDLYRRPWWAERGLPKLLKIIELYGKRTLHNIEVAMSDPEMIIGDKPPQTGTGWNFPLDTRQSMAERFRGYAGSMALTVEQYNADILAAVAKWPTEGSEIYVGGMFRGITGGARSDCDVTSWVNNGPTSMLGNESKTREVGNDPTSAFHNKKLNPMAWQREMWQSVVSRYHYLPQDPDGYIDAMTTPPITVPVTDGKERRCLSVDYGATTDPMFAQGFKIIVPKEKLSFGADNISLSGIMLRTAVGKRIAMIKSGTPWTMMHYVAMIGEAIADVCDRHNLSSVRVLQVGDDLHITGVFEELIIIIQELGPWLRGKGMDSDEHGYGNFILGHQFKWKSATQLAAFVAPRGTKSVSSATRIKRTGSGSTPPEEIHIGDEYTMVQDDPEVLENIGTYWATYGDLVCFIGDIDRWKQIVSNRYVPGRVALAVLGGVGEWALELMDAQDVEWREQQPVKQPEIESPRSVEHDAAPVQPAEPTSIVSAITPSHGSETVTESTPAITQASPPVAESVGAQTQVPATPVVSVVPAVASAAPVVPTQTPKVTHMCPHCGEALGAHYHPTIGPDVCCLKCSGRTAEQYAADKAATDPKYMTEGKDHATWPANIAWPWSSTNVT